MPHNTKIINMKKCFAEARYIIETTGFNPNTKATTILAIKLYNEKIWE